MISELKPFHCPFCNNCFSSRDYGRHYNANFPLLLKCGHSVCDSCAKSSAHRHKKIICRECQLPTDLSEGDNSVSSLLPDVYVLGVLNANMKRSLPSLKVKMQPVGPAFDVKHRQRQNYTPVVCDECLNREARWNCEKCEENFCSICFDHVHSKGIKTMQKHEKKAIGSKVYNTMIQKSCEDHTNRDLEFFCDRDKELACSYCCVTGKHKGHDVLTLRQKNSSCHTELKCAYEEALQVKRRMKLSEKELLNVIPTLRMDNSPEITKIHNHFHSLHAALQIREHELIEQVKEINSAKVIPLEKMCQQLREYQQSLDDLILDAEKTLQDPSVVINSPALIARLEGSRNLPQHLVSVSCDEPCDIEINLDEVDVLPLLKSVGCLSADVQEMYELKCTSDLPVGYTLDPVLDVASMTAETESVKSDVYSEDSLCSPVIPLTEKSTTSDISDIFKHRLYAMTHADRVIVSHIRDPGRFWVQKCTESRKLRAMSEGINKWCKSADSSKHMPSHILKGDLYLVQYSADNKWYRARVKSIYSESLAERREKGLTAMQEGVSDMTELSVDWNKDQTVEVLYVDYGNTEVVPVSRLKNIQTRFLNVPGMAKECSLYDIYPVKEDTWTPEAVKMFAKFVGNKEVVMLLSEERSGILYVDLCQAAASDITNDVPVSVRDALVFLELGQFMNQKSIAGVFTQKNVRQFLPSDKLLADSKCNVILSHIENPSLFYVQKVTTASSLSNLINDMNITYKSDAGNTLYKVYVPFPGMVCAAQYTVDKQWYRAQVLSLPGGAMVEVQYVDFGNKEVLHHRYLRKLFDRFMKLTKQAIGCSLSHVKPVAKEGWSPEAKNWMMKMAFKKQLHLKSLGIIEEENKADVILFEIQDSSILCLNSLIVEAELAAMSGPGLPEICLPLDVPPAVHSVHESATSEISTVLSKATADTEIPKSRYDKFTQPAAHCPSILAKHNYKENFVPVVISHIESPGMFFLQIGTKIEDEKVKKLMEDMQLVYEDSRNIPKELTVGGVYAVLHEKKWYRTLVLEVKDNAIKVFFLDHGFVQDVKFENVQQLADCLCSEEPLFQCCHLAGLQPAGGTKQWAKLSIETFKDAISPSSSLFCVRKDSEQEPSNSIAVELYIEVLRRGGALEPSVLEYTNIGDLLIEKGVALPLRKKNEQEVLRVSCDSKDVDGTSADLFESKSSASVDSSVYLVSRPPNTLHYQGKPTFRWKPYEKPTLRSFNAIVTYVDENGSIFLHDTEKGACTIDIVKKALCCRYANAEHVKLHIPPPVGQACIAKFHLDNEWYRAEIVSSKPESLKVLFVDYGNTENVSLGDICLDVIMTNISSQGIECQLSGIEPATEDKKWDSSILNFLHLAIVEQECIINVDNPSKPGQPVQISLMLSNGMDIKQLLVQMGGGVEIGSSSPIGSTLHDFPSLLEKKTVKTDVPIFNTFKKANPLREGEAFQVCVTQLLEPNFVFLQQLKINEPASDYDKMRNVELENFLALMEELMEKAESLPSVQKPDLGVAYCAKYSYDNSWYRCEVTNVCGDNVTVLYVDYGNSEVIPVERLRKLDDHFVDFPVQSHFCKLHRVAPVTEDGWSSDAVTAMVDSLFHCAANLYARVVNLGEICEVELLVKSEEGKWELAYQKLIDENLIKLEIQ